MPTNFYAVFIISIGMILAVGCNETSTSKMQTKTDSLDFARKVMEMYPDSAISTPARSARTSRAAVGDTSIDLSGYLPWDSVLKYKDNYDKDPFVMPGLPKAYFGFMLKKETYRAILDNASIEGLYLRFGRRSDGTYTIMVLGTNADGNLIEFSNEQAAGAHSNFDNLTPCPFTCPSNFNDN